MIMHRRLPLLAISSILCCVAWAGPGRAAGPPLPRRAAVDAYIFGPLSLVIGSKASYRVAVHWASGPGRSGPLPGAVIQLLLGEKQRGRLLVKTRTDASGSAHFRFDVPKMKTGNHFLTLKVNSRLGEMRRQVQVGVHPGGKVFLTTDKALYQPGQTIHVRSLALRSVDLLPVAGRPVRLQIRDPRGNVIHQGTGKTSRFGVASLDFALADEILTGTYVVEANIEGTSESGLATRRVTVKQYVLPKFKVSVDTEKKYYRPGDTVRGTIRGRYFFGKPVAGGRVTLSIHSQLGRLVTRHSVVCKQGNLDRGCELDAAGRYPFDLHLGTAGHGIADGELRVVAQVADTAGQLQRADLSVPLTPRPLRMVLVPENDRLIPGVKNRLHAIAGYPDGKPAVGARVKLMFRKRELAAVTDSLGVATFDVPIPVARRRSGDDEDAPQVTLSATARDPHGERAAAEQRLSVPRNGAVLVRPVRSLVAPGEEVVVRALARGAARSFTSGRRVFLDVIKAGQTLVTHTRRLRGGRATFRFQPDPALFGLLELQAYRLGRGGERLATSRMIYVHHPGKLIITATPDRKTYRPGQRARIAFEVKDSRTGEGVEAALGVRAVDEAVVALGGLKQTSQKIFFTLASQASADEAPVSIRPGGAPLSSWVERGQQSLKAARAADVLLAALRPLSPDAWETNPWRERKERWETQASDLVAAALAFMKRRPVGHRTARGWRFHPDLVSRMARAGAVKAGEVHDPWRRVVRPWHLRKQDPSFTFSPLALELAKTRLREIYDALTGNNDVKIRLIDEAVPKLDRTFWPAIIPRTIMDRLIKIRALAKHQVLDPWGRAYRVSKNPRVLLDAYDMGLVSRYVIHSAGPDGRFGTADDVNPPGTRKSIKVIGRSKKMGADAARYLLRLGTMGTIGHGGGGGSGAGYGRGVGRLSGRRARSPSIRMGSMPGRVRSRFPETLLWRPQVITDRQGKATVELDMADSITDWRLVATGSTAGGLLGATSISLRVFQEFFVDPALPAALTEGDRISVPVTVYNYLKTPQKITVQLKPQTWFSIVGPAAQQITLGPSQVGLRLFTIVAKKIGRQDLTIMASAVSGSRRTADTVRRSTVVEPDGVERATSFGGTLDAGGVSGADHTLTAPASIDRTRRVTLKVFPGAVSQTLEGMQAMLRMPHGCFEQTSSTTYPNVLVLDYLRRTKQATPKIEQRATRFISAGYQRLVKFEVNGGGFSWFGKAPANRVLTAYGLMEFFDMSRVHPVDPGLIARTQAWLVKQQRKDGSWGPDRHNIMDGVVNNLHSHSLRITAYIARALRVTGYSGIALRKARAFIKKKAHLAKDPYTLALIGGLVAGDRSRTSRDVLRRLWAFRKPGPGGLFFQSPRSTLTLGSGRSGTIETTALAALALLRSPAPPSKLDRVLGALATSKDSRGGWHSTQATILSLRALLLQQRKMRSRPRGRVSVLVNGKRRTTLSLNSDRSTAFSLNLTPVARSTRQRVQLRFEGAGKVQYHLVNRYWTRRRGGAGRDVAAGQALKISTRYSRSQMRGKTPVQLDVDVENRGKRRVQMPIVSVALPPGFSMDPGGLAALVTLRGVEKAQRSGNRAVLYLSRLDPGQRMRFTLNLQSQHPLRVQVRPSTIYEYYRPENRAASTPQILLVQNTRVGGRLARRPGCSMEAGQLRCR